MYDVLTDAPAAAAAYATSGDPPTKSHFEAAAT
jgi:hypothetical protein